MARIWLLFGLLALAGGQLVYPDQYERMTVGTSRAPVLGLLAPALQTVSSNQSVQINNQSNRESVPQSGVAGPETARISPTTQLPFYPSVSPVANSTTSLLLENWSNHVSRYRYLHVICMRNNKNLS